jgi:myo-inositol 2-dehydrogenase/D-chiro-inositol 1-dehydrogenase
MKFGIIGAGMIGHFHAKAITAMTGGELQSVFDLRAEAAEKIAAEYGGKARRPRAGDRHHRHAFRGAP